jgi:membrane protein YqaA with SNARE-associated domain
MNKDFEHFFKCLSAIGDLFVVNSLFSSIPQFFDWVVCFFEVSFLNSLCILVISPLLNVGLLKTIFFPIHRLQICPNDYVLCFTEVFQFH